MITAQPGQKVTVLSDSASRNVPMRVLTVTARTKTKITCDDGTEWKNSGHRWGRSDRWYTGETIEDHRPEHDARIARRRAIYRAKVAVEAIDWSRMSAEQATALEAVVKPYAKEKGK